MADGGCGGAAHRLLLHKVDHQGLDDEKRVDVRVRSHFLLERSRRNGRLERSAVAPVYIPRAECGVRRCKLHRARSAGECHGDGPRQLAPRGARHVWAVARAAGRGASLCGRQQTYWGAAAVAVIAELLLFLVHRRQPVGLARSTAVGWELGIRCARNDVEVPARTFEGSGTRWGPSREI